MNNNKWFRFSLFCSWSIEHSFVASAFCSGTKKHGSPSSPLSKKHASATEDSGTFSVASRRITDDAVGRQETRGGGQRKENPRRSRSGKMRLFLSA